MTTPLAQSLNILSIENSPHFHFTNETFKNLEVDQLILSGNKFRDGDLPANTFGGLKVKDLDISNNSLNHFPLSLLALQNLEGLDISDNEMDSYNQDSKVLRELGKTLLRFSFGHDNFDHWPSSILRHFPKLQELNVTRAQMSLMPVDAFYGFSGTLRKLTIQNTLLRSVPLAISQLDYLRELHFDSNHYVGDYGMNVPLSKEFLTHLALISLQGDNITTFPNVLGQFQNLSSVIMDKNNLRFVSDKSAIAVQNITSLSLIHSGITRIPGAIQDINNLQSIDLSQNNIHSIEREDLRNSTKLETIKLNNNPLMYISVDAFYNLSNIQNIELRNTNLTAIPCSLKYLCLESHDITIDLTGNKIDCTCSLKWLYDWSTSVSNHQFTILGECETITSSIDNYLKTDVASCKNSDLCGRSLSRSYCNSH